MPKLYYAALVNALYIVYPDGSAEFCSGTEWRKSLFLWNTAVADRGFEFLGEL